MKSDKGFVFLVPGAVTHIYVAHDDWCAIFKPGGSCNCNSIELRRDVERMVEEDDQ